MIEDIGKVVSANVMEASARYTRECMREVRSDLGRELPRLLMSKEVAGPLFRRGFVCTLFLPVYMLTHVAKSVLGGEKAKNKAPGRANGNAVNRAAEKNAGGVPVEVGAIV